MSVFSCCASLLSNGYLISRNASARPCTPSPIGRCRMLLRLACQSDHILFTDARYTQHKKYFICFNFISQVNFNFYGASSAWAEFPKKWTFVNYTNTTFLHNMRDHSMLRSCAPQETEEPVKTTFCYPRTELECRFWVQAELICEIWSIHQMQPDSHKKKLAQDFDLLYQH